MRDPDKPQAIIDAAIRVFARNGYYNSRVSDIAREAGIASGTIYLYFKTKDDILVRLFREKMAEWVALVRKEVAAERDPLAKIRKIVALHFRVLQENPDLAEVVQVELRQGNKFFRGASAHEVSAYFDVIQSVLEEGVAAGRVRRDLALKVATLNRPPANAISEPLMTELNAALSSVEEDDAVRSVIITGAGDRIFCAGADLGSAFSGGSVATFIRFGNSVMRRIERFPKPVIAALNGHALGGGCEIAMACHFRLLKETARMGQTESNLGIIPGYGGTQRLPRLIGRTKALEFLILGTQIPAPECLALGLVNRLCKEGETLADARALARQIAKRPPIATRLIIEAVDEGLEAPIDKASEIEVRAFLKTLRTEDASEGIQAFFAKREPSFKGR